MVDQFSVTLPPYPRGFHLITNEILKAISSSKVQVGIVHVFIQHTSASLSINENADPTVRSDMESFVNRLVSEDSDYFLHTYEGSDDMPAHIKSSLFGSSISCPLSGGNLLLGTWQGIYLCEHRNHGGQRKLIITVQGELN